MISAFAFLALAGPSAAAPASGTSSTTPASSAPSAPARDDSTHQAVESLRLVAAVYGGEVTWDPMAGVRYDAIFTIPGPEGVPVRTWTESHIVWVKGSPKMRIDNGADSTVVLVVGDTTWVRRDGAWTSDSSAVAASRATALDARWVARIPWCLMFDPGPKRRIEQPITADSALVVRAEYGPGQDRPAGTILRATFAPPTFGLSTVHWYDPTSKAWFLLEMSDEVARYGWRWARRRTLRASDAAGTRGPIALETRIEDFAVASSLPDAILEPPVGPR